jgi:uncharacterized protein YhbP (UPF0306 family)
MGGDLSAVARRIIDEGRYMTLATADAEGRPWASPVWYAPSGYGEFIWVSATDDVRHSQNIVARAEIALVIFDSTVAPGAGQAVYVEARAEQLAGDDIARGVDVFSERSVSQGIGPWSLEQVTRENGTRLYRAVAQGHWVLDHDNAAPGDRRIAVELWL